MTDRPIIFSGPMVRAVIDERKTQTRRVLKPQPLEDRFWGPELYHPVRVDRRGEEYPGPAVFGIYGDEWGQRLPYAPGDRLWVREAFVTGWPLTPEDDLDQYDENGNENPLTVWYRATEDINRWVEDGYHRNVPWRSPRYMPRWASRLTLTVTDVRVQRLQEISEEDAVAEGVVWQEPTEEDRQWARDRAEEYGWAPQIDGVWIAPGTRQGYGPKPQRDNPQWGPTAAFAYRCLWNSLHGPGAWDANPWVAAISFTVQRGNIDEARP